MPQRPPRLAERLLAATLGRGEWSESILGDLHEEYLHYVKLTGSGSGWRAGAWYWAQSVRLAGRSLFERRRRRTVIARFTAWPRSRFTAWPRL